jgi:hypothetical protein
MVKKKLTYYCFFLRKIHHTQPYSYQIALSRFFASVFFLLSLEFLSSAPAVDDVVGDGCCPLADISPPSITVEILLYIRNVEGDDVEEFSFLIGVEVFAGVCADAVAVVDDVDSDEALEMEGFCETVFFESTVALESGDIFGFSSTK